MKKAWKNLYKINIKFIFYFLWAFHAHLTLKVPSTHLILLFIISFIPLHCIFVFLYFCTFTWSSYRSSLAFNWISENKYKKQLKRIEWIKKSLALLGVIIFSFISFHSFRFNFLFHFLNFTSFIWFFCIFSFVHNDV